MRVMLVTGSYPPDPCGVGDYTASLHRHLAADPLLEVAVLTTCRGAPASREDDRARVFRSMRGWSVTQTMRFVRALREWSPDIVHVQYPTQGYAGEWLPALIPRLSRLLGKHVVQTWHEPYSRSSVGRLLMQATVSGGLVVVRPDYRALLHPWLRWALLGKRFRYVRSASTLPASTLDASGRDALKQRLLHGQQRLIVFFGFIYPHKRVEQLFEIANPASDHIVIAGALDPDSEYVASIRRLATTAPWNGKATLLGFLPARDVASLLAVADAVVLPFQFGGGDWNTSIHAAVAEQAFVLTTSRTVVGYDTARNVYFAVPDDLEDMRTALARYAGAPRARSAIPREDAWKVIAAEHIVLYRELLADESPQ